MFTPTIIGSYVTAAGLIGLGVYHLSTGDVPSAIGSFAAAFGIPLAAHSGPAKPAV